jgi:hypothetical protein
MVNDMSESTDQCSRSIEERLILASCGGCTCGIKTPVLEYHNDLCHYRIFEDVGTILALKDKRMDEFRLRAEKAEKTLRFYANPEIYKQHPHGPSFDRRTDLYLSAQRALEDGE